MWHVLPMSVKHWGRDFPEKEILHVRLINIKYLTTLVFLNSLFILMLASTKGALTETMEVTRTAEDHVFTNKCLVLCTKMNKILKKTEVV